MQFAPTGPLSCCVGQLLLLLIVIGELRRSARHQSYDEEPLPDVDSEVVDFRAASELFAPVRTLRRSDLRTLRLLTPHQGHDVPTIGGVLLFGRDRERYFPDAWIQAGRFEGPDRSRILDSAEIKSLPVPAVEETIAFVRRNISREAVIGAVRRVDRWTFPPAALREAVVNAVVHTDYSQRGGPIRIAIFDDRLEVENPGLLPFGLTVERHPAGRLPTAQPGHRPRFPRTGADRAVGKRHPTHDPRLPGSGAG